MSDAKIPLAAVIGSPIAHSKSPAIHQHWLKANNLPGFYIPMDVAQADLANVISMMPKMGFVGANVTVPHKVSVLALADLVTDRASLIGAANTLIFRSDGRIHADNTDGYGFIQNVRSGAEGWDPKSGPAAVLGAGGAARAVVASLIDVGVPEIRITNRTRTSADALRSEFGNKVVVYDWVQAGNAIENAATVVNATSLGMTGKPELRVPLDALSRDAVVNDLVYAPLETQFLRAAKDQGCRTVDGLGMLLYQAAPAFERWFGVRPEVDDKLRAIALSS